MLGFPIDGGLGRAADIDGLVGTSLDITIAPIPMAQARNVPIIRPTNPEPLESFVATKAFASLMAPLTIF
jgi:hypothetical protein